MPARTMHRSPRRPGSHPGLRPARSPPPRRRRASPGRGRRHRRPDRPPRAAPRPVRRAATEAPSMRTWRARVVEVVLARDAVPAALEHPAEQVADERAARVADRQRAGRVGRDELDVDMPRVVRPHAAEAVVGQPGLVEHVLQERWREPQVDEAGRRDLDVLEHHHGRGSRARTRRPRRCAAAASASAARASSRGSSRGRHARGPPVARPRCPEVAGLQRWERAARLGPLQRRREERPRTRADRGDAVGLADRRRFCRSSPRSSKPASDHEPPTSTTRSISASRTGPS